MTDKTRQWMVASLGVFLFLGNLAVAKAQQLTEGFELATFPPTNWLIRNQSVPGGTNAQCWNRFTGTAPWAPHTGTGQAGANFNCTTGDNTISGWFITPH